MKAKKLVTLALPIMLLGGCVTIETGKKEEPKKEETSKAEDKKSESKKEDSLTVAKGEDTKSSSSSSSSNSSNSSSSSTGKVSGSDVEAYKSEIVSNATKIDDTMKLIEKVANSDVKSYKQKKSEVQLGLGGAKAYATKLKNLKAPSEFSGEQAKIKQSMELYEDSFQLLFDALDHESESKMKQAVDKAGKGSKLFEEAATSIGNRTN